MSSQHSLFLQINGVAVTIEFDTEELYKRIRHDFSYFEVNTTIKDDIFLRVYLNPPPFSEIRGSQKFSFRKVKSFDHQSLRYNNYDDQLLSIYDFNKEEGRIYSMDVDLLHEITYLLILSRVGKKQDLLGLHRLHAMSVCNTKQTIVACGDSGVGKSSACLDFLSNNYKLLADDVTLVNTKGEVHSYPVRIGLNDPLINDLSYILLNRRVYGPKFLYSSQNYVASTYPKIATVILLKERNNIESTVSKASVFTSTLYVIKYLVIGIGTPQILEYFWECGVSDFYTKTKIALLRIWACFNFIRKNKFYTVSLKNGDSLRDVLVENCILLE